MTTTNDEERKHLAKSDQHIAESERLIGEQERRIAQLRGDGQDVAAFEDVLSTMQALLKEHHAHRMVILDTISRRENAASE